MSAAQSELNARLCGHSADTPAPLTPQETTGTSRLSQGHIGIVRGRHRTEPATTPLARTTGLVPQSRVDCVGSHSSAIDRCGSSRRVLRERQEALLDFGWHVQTTNSFSPALEHHLQPCLVQRRLQACFCCRCVPFLQVVVDSRHIRQWRGTFAYTCGRGTVRRSRRGVRSLSGPTHTLARVRVYLMCDSFKMVMVVVVVVGGCGFARSSERSLFDDYNLKDPLSLFDGDPVRIRLVRRLLAVTSAAIVIAIASASATGRRRSRKGSTFPEGTSSSSTRETTLLRRCGT
mmetsp:Transcript_2191/g.6906  ORF Transcript_2191/g.6906 Transcript_2191/m.6906 type:complete len:289 (+) Transcript_2191:811-1677(+)